jgi:hypothetical protein
MASWSIHTMEGDPDDLLARKRQHMDPVVGPGPADPTQSAVLVPVPEAERVVSRHRGRLDAAAALGVPAHVTVL